MDQAIVNSGDTAAKFAGPRRRERDVQAPGREQALVLSELASSLAHEMKNPLAGMMLSAGRLERALHQNEKLGLIAGSLCASIRALSDTVDRITGAMGQPEPNLEPMDLNRAIEDAAGVIERQAEAQGIRIVRALAPGIPAVRGDPALLGCALRNILANAVEAMPSGGVLRLESRATPEGGAEALVADSGPGVPPELAANPFKPFRSTKPGRAGLGLSLVRRVLELHGGEAGLRPGAGGGTEAVLAFPAAGEGGRPA